MIEELARGREEEFAELLAQHYRPVPTSRPTSRARANAARAARLYAPRRYMTLSGVSRRRAPCPAQAERFYGEVVACGAESNNASCVSAWTV